MTQDLTTTSFIERGTPEWDRMWAELAKHPLNTGLDKPTEAEFECEYWEYMGPGVQGGHCFRHRCHPKTWKREYVIVPEEN